MKQQTLPPTRAGVWGMRAIASVAALLAGINFAAAQEIEPSDFVPAPPGTNAVLGYYIFGHDTSYNTAKGGTVSDAGLEVNLGLARYVHWTSVAGMPAGYQIIEAFGSEGDAHIGSASLGNTFGASNPALSAFIWPYTNTQKKQYFFVGGYIYPPIGSYNKDQALNVASALSGWNGWAGDGQLGWDQGIGEHFSYDLGFDARAYGATTVPGGVRSTKDPDFRLEAWANWNWTAKLQTSIGWETFLGGTGYANTAFTGTIPDGSKSESERIRFAASYFVLPNAQVLLEANHEFVAVGGFKQTFGLTARFLFLF